MIRSFNSRTVGGPAADIAMSMVDPFERSACIPDASSGTGCFSLRQQSLIQTGLGTCCVYLQTADPLNWNYADTNSANATPTLAGASSWNIAAAITSVQGFYRAWRPVSMGVRANFVGNTNTDGGVIVCGVLAANVTASSLNGLTIANFCSLMKEYKLVSLRSGATVTWRPDSMDDMIAWRTTLGGAASTLNVQTLGVQIPWIVIAVYGANASSNCLQIESIVNYEGQVSQQTFLAGGTSSVPRAPAESGWYEKALGAIRDVPSIAPYLASAFSGFTNGGLLGAASNVAGMIMGNGYAYPKVLSSPSRRLLAQY